MSGGIAFDNFWLGHSSALAHEFAEKTFTKKHLAELTQKNDEELQMTGDLRETKWKVSVTRKSAHGEY